MNSHLLWKRYGCLPIVNLKRVHVEHSIYEYIEQQLGYIVDKSHRRIEVHTANKRMHQLL